MNLSDSNVGAQPCPVNTPSSKTCTRCKRTQPLSEFSKHKQTSDGKRSHCKACRREAFRRWKRANPEKVLEADRRRRQANPEKVQERVRRWQQANPEKKQAHVVLNNAVKLGKIVRSDRCSACGVRCTPDGHHEDHSKPLDVVWLCRRCHNDVHAQP